MVFMLSLAKRGLAITDVQADFVSGLFMLVTD